MKNILLFVFFLNVVTNICMANSKLDLTIINDNEESLIITRNFNHKNGFTAQIEKSELIELLNDDAEVFIIRSKYLNESFFEFYRVHDAGVEIILKYLEPFYTSIDLASMGFGELKILSENETGEGLKYVYEGLATNLRIGLINKLITKTDLVLKREIFEAVINCLVQMVDIGLVDTEKIKKSLSSLSMKVRSEEKLIADTLRETLLEESLAIELVKDLKKRVNDSPSVQDFLMQTAQKIDLSKHKIFKYILD